MNNSVHYIHDEVVHNSRAAAIILPLLFDIYKPSSILDVGCGLGNWLEVAKKIGLSDIKGIDGNYVDRSLLKISAHEFVEANLNEPINLNRRFDLAICLEVAEHLKPESANSPIETLTRHADVILFSAAIPGQGGQYHINEQWPSYWQEKFNKHNYDMVDCFRPLIWDNENIEYWYRQNLFLVVNRSHELYNRLEKRTPLSLVHPELLKLVNVNHQHKIQKLNNTLARLSSRDFIGKISRIFR